MRQKLVYFLIAALLLSLVATRLPQWFGKRGPSTDDMSTSTTPAKPAVQVDVPAVHADSAFLYVKKQVDFGARVPGSAAHKKCAAWLVSEFKRHGMTVIEQKFKAEAYFGTLDAVNIIAQYRPELPNRILLCAHWDSRHIADHDTRDKDKPILGADDGGSGVALLLEMARLLHANPANIGVDLICFDAEDLGKESDDEAPADSPTMLQQAQDNSETWCLGSQHWASNLHKPGYRANFGILLDMVGARGAVFPREGYSTVNAPVIQDKIWAVAAELGYGNLFTNKRGGGITDDHVFVMRGTRIPTVDIISMPNDPPRVFGRYHHTHDDNLDIIDRDVLASVGKVVTTVVYRSAAGAF
ncbi:MAG TPA: M28 family peptidase [Saprospiraceae bacterium]|nr:M28 family peptidase [Saprospiraceae bacterium]